MTQVGPCVREVREPQTQVVKKNKIIIKKIYLPSAKDGEQTIQSIVNISAAADRLDKGMFCCNFQSSQAISEGCQRINRVCLVGCKLSFHFLSKYVDM